MSKKSSYPQDPSQQYPQQGQQYPQQGQYPPAHPSAPPAYPGGPPAYSTAPGYQPPPPYGYAPGPAQYSMPAPPGPAYPQQMAYNMPMVAPQHLGSNPNYNPGYPVQAGFNYQAINTPAVAQFDSGARFDGIASPNVPPPPPGCAPNAAQMATSQGRPVVGTQKKASWFSGGSGGGVSFW